MPDRLCVELKSLKLYLHAYRDRGIFYEAVTNVILDDLVAAVAPRSMTVEGDFNVRGGISSVVRASYEAARPAAGEAASEGPHLPGAPLRGRARRPRTPCAAGAGSRRAASGPPSTCWARTCSTATPRGAAPRPTRSSCAPSPTAIERNISIKLSMMGLDIARGLLPRADRGDPGRGARGRAASCASTWRARSTPQRTIDVFRKLRKTYDNVGIVLQAYLHRTEDDVKEAIARGDRVRLCKGAYKEPARVAWTGHGRDPRELHGAAPACSSTSGNYPAIATHDESLVQDVLALRAEQRIPPQRFEFQMLYGLRPAPLGRAGGGGTEHARLRALRHPLDPVLLPAPARAPGERLLRPAQPVRRLGARAVGSEADDGPDGELDLLQGSLAEPERVTEVTGIFVVQQRGLVSKVSAKADRLPGKVFDAAAEAERQLRLGLEIVPAQEGRAETREDKRSQPRVRGPEQANGVAVQLAHGHREEVRASGPGLEPERRRLLRPGDLCAPVRRERTRQLNAPGESVSDVESAQLRRLMVEAGRWGVTRQAGQLPRLRPRRRRQRQEADGDGTGREAVHGLSPRITM